MTCAEHLVLLTASLVGVARHGQHDLAGPELDIALLGRRGVLELRTTVHESLTGLGLRRHPRPPCDRAPSDAFVLPATTVAGTRLARGR